MPSQGVCAVYSGWRVMGENMMRGRESLREDRGLSQEGGQWDGEEGEEDEMFRM